MVNTLNTDIAKELNITARRNDTFQMLLEVRDSGGNLIDFSANNDLSKPIHQAKMTISNAGGDRILSIYSEQWRNSIEGVEVSNPDGDQSNYTHPSDTPPSPTSEGHYTGGTGVGSAIHLAAQTTSGKVTINVPYTHLDFQAGKYNYDFQIRKQSSAAGAVEYTTWLYGTFTLRADITKIG